MQGGRAELEAAAARYAISDALLSLAEVAAPEDEDLAFQIAVGRLEMEAVCLRANGFCAHGPK